MDVVSLDFRCYSNCKRLYIGEDPLNSKEDLFKEIWSQLGQEVLVE